MKERTRDVQVLSLLHAGIHRVMLGLGQASWSTSSLCDTSLKKGPSCMEAYDKKNCTHGHHSPFHFLTHIGNGERKNLIGCYEEHTILWPFYFSCCPMETTVLQDWLFTLNKSRCITDRHGNEKYRGVIVRQNRYLVAVQTYECRNKSMGQG